MATVGSNDRASVLLRVVFLVWREQAESLHPITVYTPRNVHLNETRLCVPTQAFPPIL